MVCSSGGGVPVECHAREGGGLLRRWEDTVKRCSCREYASLQRGGEREKVKVRVGEKKRRKGAVKFNILIYCQRVGQDFHGVF